MKVCNNNTKLGLSGNANMTWQNDISYDIYDPLKSGAEGRERVVASPLLGDTPKLNAVREPECPLRGSTNGTSFSGSISGVAERECVCVCVCCVSYSRRNFTFNL